MDFFYFIQGNNMKKHNAYFDTKLARRLSKNLQIEVLFSARKHDKESKQASWSIPDNHSLLINKTKDQVKGMNRIWFECVAIGSKQGR